MLGGELWVLVFAINVEGLISVLCCFIINVDIYYVPINTLHI